MANLLQSSQNQATNAPSFYTNYLSGLASAGTAAQQAATYQGAQPLQTQAFCAAGTGAGSQTGTFNTAGTSLGSAMCSAGGIAGAANPYLTTAATNNPAAMAQSYMNPYICSAVNKMSDIAQRNIQMNLAPQATAAAVGSGQFGSQRGAQVLGQVEANAEQCLNNSIANMLSTGYSQALCAAGKQQSLLGTLGSTAASAQAQQAQAQNQAAANQTALGTAATNARLACINALATLGGQQQTIAQNAQCYPLTTLAKNASLLQGYAIPTSTTTTLCMSPLSAAAAVGSGVMGMLTPGANGVTPLTSLQNALGLGTTSSGNAAGTAAGTAAATDTGTSTATDTGTPVSTAPVSETSTATDANGNVIGTTNSGNGLSTAATGVNTGGLPVGCGCSSGYASARGGLIQSNATGCRSTTNRGALPSSR